MRELKGKSPITQTNWKIRKERLKATRLAFCSPIGLGDEIAKNSFKRMKATKNTKIYLTKNHWDLSESKKKINEAISKRLLKR